MSQSVALDRGRTSNARFVVRGDEAGIQLQDLADFAKREVGQQICFEPPSQRRIAGPRQLMNGLNRGAAGRCVSIA